MRMKWISHDDKQSWDQIHRHCHKIYLQIHPKAITGQKLRYPKIILQHVLSEFTEFVSDDCMICHKIARFCLKTCRQICRICPVNGITVLSKCENCLKIILRSFMNQARGR